MSQYTVTIPAAKVPSDQTNFPLLIKLADMPQSFWDTVIEGGGDIRVYAEGGVTEFARDVQSATKATQTGWLWVLVPAMSAAEGAVVIVDVDGIRSGYANSDPFGRDAVWVSDYAAVVHSGRSVDSSGKNTLSFEGNAPSATTGKIGEASEYSSGGLKFNTVNGFTLESGYQITFWADINFFTAWAPVLILQDQTFSTHAYIRWQRNNETNNLRIVHDGADAQSVTIDGILNNLFDTSKICKYDLTWDGSTLRGFKDGVVILSRGYTRAPPNPTSLGFAVVGYQNGATRTSIAVFDEFRVRTNYPGPDWLAMEYENQNDPSTFYTVSEGAGGAAVPTLSAPTVSNVTANSVTPNVTVTF